ncbi:MAG: transporter substrate-binding domain-containing protein [Parachlamydiales bacterium]|jgi:polar amino acid transport system substrate-binding protein
MANFSLNNIFEYYRKPFVRIPLLIILGLLVLWGILRSCSDEAMRKDYFRIGRDVTWYPLDLGGKEQNMVGFTNDLFDEISGMEDLHLEIFDVTSKSLIFGLERGNWEGALSSMPADVVNRQKYEFSKPLYILGYVLLVPIDSTIKSFDDIDGKIIGILKEQALESSIAQKDAIFTPYPRISKAIEDLSANRIDAVIIDFVSSQRYLQGVYSKKIKIVTAPSQEDSIRLVAKKGTSGAYLIKRFDVGLEKMIRDGSYEKMLVKWSLASQQ